MLRKLLAATILAASVASAPALAATSKVLTVEDVPLGTSVSANVFTMPGFGFPPYALADFHIVAGTTGHAVQLGTAGDPIGNFFIHFAPAAPFIDPLGLDPLPPLWGVDMVGFDVFIPNADFGAHTPRIDQVHVAPDTWYHLTAGWGVLHQIRAPVILLDNFRLIEADHSDWVPEPATWAMMLVGFGGLGAQLRRLRRRRAVTAT